MQARLDIRLGQEVWQCLLDDALCDINDESIATDDQTFIPVDGGRGGLLALPLGRHRRAGLAESNRAVAAEAASPLQRSIATAAFIHRVRGTVAIKGTGREPVIVQAALPPDAAGFTNVLLLLSFLSSYKSSIGVSGFCAFSGQQS